MAPSRSSASSKRQRSASFSLSRCLWARSRPTRKRWHVKHFMRSTWYSCAKSMGLYTGAQSSTWPMCPGQSRKLRPHVGHIAF